MTENPKCVKCNTAHFLIPIDRKMKRVVSRQYETAQDSWSDAEHENGSVTCRCQKCGATVVIMDDSWQPPANRATKHELEQLGEYFYGNGNRMRKTPGGGWELSM